MASFNKETTKSEVRSITETANTHEENKQKRTKENYSPFQNEVYLLSTLENMTGSD